LCNRLVTSITRGLGGTNAPKLNARKLRDYILWTTRGLHTPQHMGTALLSAGVYSKFLKSAYPSTEIFVQFSSQDFPGKH